MLPHCSTFKLFLFPTLVSLILTQQHPSFATSDHIYYDTKCEENAGSYTSTSTYKQNVNGALSHLVANASDTYFHHTSQGSGEDEVFGIFYCRFDISSSACQDCIQSAAKRILQKCTDEKAASIYYDVCILRYAHHPLNNVYEDRIGIVQGYFKVKNPGQFMQVLGETFNGLTQKAAYNSSYEGHAHEVRQVTDSQKAYCFVQCRPDTIGEYCNRCLRVLLTNVAACFSDGSSKRWALVLTVNCMVRFDTGNFLEVSYNGDTPYHSPPFGNVPPPPPRLSNSGGRKVVGNDEMLKLLCALASLLTMLVFLAG